MIFLNLYQSFMYRGRGSRRNYIWNFEILQLLNKNDSPICYWLIYNIFVIFFFGVLYNSYLHHLDFYNFFKQNSNKEQECIKSKKTLLLQIYFFANQNVQYSSPWDSITPPRGDSITPPRESPDQQQYKNPATNLNRDR